MQERHAVVAPSATHLFAQRATLIVGVCMLDLVPKLAQAGVSLAAPPRLGIDDRHSQIVAPMVFGRGRSRF